MSTSPIITTQQGTKGDTGDQGIQGIQGDQGVQGEGVAIGGTAGQHLEKVDGTDFNTQWVEPIIGMTAGKFEVVAALPGTPDPNTIYFVTA